MKTIVIDLDGTLCDSAHRDHHARNSDWDQFHALLTEDEPHPDVLWFIKAMSWDAVNADVELIGCTGRNERWRIATEKWLMEHGALLDCVLMRPDFDFRPDHDLKIEMLEEWHYESGAEGRPQDRVAFILEDREKVVEAWRNAGYNCWQVRPGNF